MQTKNKREDEKEIIERIYQEFFCLVPRNLIKKVLKKVGLL